MGLLGKIVIYSLFANAFYILVIRPIVLIVINVKFKENKLGVPITENLDNITLLEYLRNKGFTYPELKNIRHNELGQVVIEGKFTSHPLEIREQTLYVGRGDEGNVSRKINCILEAVVIGKYLSKFFDPNAPVDAYKDYSSFKTGRRFLVFVSIALHCAVIIPLVIMAIQKNAL